MSNILDYEESHTPRTTTVIKTILLFALLKMILDLIGRFYIIPILPKKIFPEDFPNQALGLYTMVVILVVCIYLVKKLNQLRPEAPILRFPFWAAICIFLGEMCFQMVIAYVFNGTEVNRHFRYIATEALIFAIQAGFISNVVIHYQRGLTLLIPILLTGGLFFLMDYMFANNWL